MKQFEKLSVTVYRFSLGDCTNHGLSSRKNTIDCYDGELSAIIEHCKQNNIDMNDVLYVVRRELWGEKHPYLTPLEWAANKPNGNVCAGGNYANGDSRWYEWFGHYLPLPIHDRIETWEEYDALSR